MFYALGLFVTLYLTRLVLFWAFWIMEILRFIHLERVLNSCEGNLYVGHDLCPKRCKCVACFQDLTQFPLLQDLLGWHSLDRSSTTAYGDGITYHELSSCTMLISYPLQKATSTPSSVTLMNSRIQLWTVIFISYRGIIPRSSIPTTLELMTCKEWSTVTPHLLESFTMKTQCSTKLILSSCSVVEAWSLQVGGA